MPIVVQHQPPFSRLGELAYKTGQSQYADRRRREEEARLMQERQMAQQQNMQDQRLAVDVWGRQFGQMGALQRMAIGAQQQQQRDQQQQQFNLDRIDVGHQNLIKINEMQNLNVAERDDRLANSYDDRVRLSDELTRARNEENFGRDVERMTLQDDLNTGQTQQRIQAAIEGKHHQSILGPMTHTAQKEYLNTLQQENEIESGMRSNEINEEQGQQQLQQIRQERAAIASRPVSYIGGLAPGESRPSQSNPGYNETRGQDGSVTFSRNLTPYQGLPERDREQEWINDNSQNVLLPDGSSVVRVPDPSNPGEYEDYPVKSQEVLAQEASVARSTIARVQTAAIKDAIDSLLEERKEITEGLDYVEGEYTLRMGSIDGEVKQLRSEYMTAIRSLTSAVTPQAAGAAGAAGAADVADVAEGPLPGEQPPIVPPGQEGMPLPNFIPEGEGAPVGLVDRGGEIVPPNEAFAGPQAGQIGSLVVDPTAPHGSEGNPVHAPTAMNAVMLPVGTYFQTPRGVVERVTEEHKRRAGLPIGVGAGAAGAGAAAIETLSEAGMWPTWGGRRAEPAGPGLFAGGDHSGGF